MISSPKKLKGVARIILGDTYYIYMNKFNKIGKRGNNNKITIRQAHSSMRLPRAPMHTHIIRVQHIIPENQEGNK